MVVAGMGGSRGGCCRSMLPACWGGGGARCRHTTSAPPPELGSASQTASPAPAPRPAGRPCSHTAPFTRWEQSTGQDRTGRVNDREQSRLNQHPSFMRTRLNHRSQQIKEKPERDASWNRRAEVLMKLITSMMEGEKRQREGETKPD